MSVVALVLCELCKKVIMPKDARVNYGRKTYHGPCFVQHCKESHMREAK